MMDITPEKAVQFVKDTRAALEPEYEKLRLTLARPVKAHWWQFRSIRKWFCPYVGGHRFVNDHGWHCRMCGWSVGA